MAHLSMFSRKIVQKQIDWTSRIDSFSQKRSKWAWFSAKWAWLKIFRARFARNCTIGTLLQEILDPPLLLSQPTSLHSHISSYSAISHYCHISNYSPTSHYRHITGALDSISDLRCDFRLRTSDSIFRLRTRFYCGREGHWTRFQIYDAISDFGRDLQTSDAIFRLRTSDAIFRLQTRFPDL